MNASGLCSALRSIGVEVRLASRSPRNLILGIGLPLGLYVAYTRLGIGGISGVEGSAVDWRSYLMVSMGAFGAMNAAVGVAAGPFRTARSGVSDSGSEERRHDRPRLAARTIAAILLALAPLLLLGLAGSREGVRLSGPGWIELILALWLGVVPFALFGSLLGISFDRESGGLILVGVLVPLAILGGFFQPLETLPATLEAVGRVVPSYHLADLGWTTLADHRVDPVDVLAQAGYAIAIGAIVVWRAGSEDGRRAEGAARDDGARAR